MDYTVEILNNLIVIKWLLVTTLFIIFLIGISNFLRGVLSLKKQIREYNENEFKDKANQLLNENELEKADKLIQERLKKEPNNSYANYYLARLQYIKKDYDGCTKTLQKLLELTPQWKEKYITPILSQIEDIKS